MKSYQLPNLHKCPSDLPFLKPSLDDGVGLVDFVKDFEVD